MKRWTVGLAITAWIALLTPVHAQWLSAPTAGIPHLPDGRPDLTARVPRAPDGRPDLSGVWRRAADDTNSTTALASALKEIPLRPSARELYDRRLAVDGAGRGAERCLPHGLPLDMMFREAPFRVVQTPTLTVILLEMFNRFRQVPTDGRRLGADFQPTWLGYSTGSWDGDEFVIDTVGFNDQTWLDNRGLPHSDALHLTERFKRLNVGRMDLALTVDDPKAYTRPWSIAVKFELVPDTDLLEYVCDNEKWTSRAQAR